MTESEREAYRARAFEVIRANIARRGYHAYRIDGGPSPRSRYDDDDGWPRWGLFATRLDPVPRELVRFAPVGTFLALDTTIDAVAGLAEGQIAHRDGPGAPWVVRAMGDVSPEH